MTTPIVTISLSQGALNGEFLPDVFPSDRWLFLVMAGAWGEGVAQGAPSINALIRLLARRAGLGEAGARAGIARLIDAGYAEGKSLSPLMVPGLIINFESKD